ncbi:MAG: hypothetical protein ACI9K5_002998 [Gammaproteobacteria bacterium]
MRSLLALAGLSLEAPGHTTLSRRSKGLSAKLIPIASKKPVHLIIDGRLQRVESHARPRVAIVGEGLSMTLKGEGDLRRRSAFIQPRPESPN